MFSLSLCTSETRFEAMCWSSVEEMMAIKFYQFHRCTAGRCFIIDGNLVAVGTYCHMHLIGGSYHVTMSWHASRI